MRIVIDHRGRVWGGSTNEIRKHFWLVGSDDYVETQLVKLVGGIAVRFQTKVAHVRLNPRIVAGPALAELYYRLSDHAPERIALYTCDGNVCAMHVGLSSAMRSISEEIEACSTDDELTCKTFDLDIGLLDDASAFGILLSQLQFKSGEFMLGEFQSVLNGPLAGRWLAVEPVGTGCDMRVIQCGTGYGIPTAEFCRQLSGALLSNLPDEGYAKWVAKSYERAIASDAPLFQSARSVATWNNGELVQAEYARLVVPIKQKSGRTLLLSTSRRSNLRRLDGSRVA